MTPKPRALAAICLVLSLGLPACANETTRAQTPVQALQAIERAIGEAPCDSNADCRTIGVGAKACGGPERYLPWSVRYTQADKLQRLVEQHRSLRTSENTRDGRVSNCAVVTDLGTTCVARRCQMNPPGSDAGIQLTR
ncbi:hypothetical protein [Roseateles asaccharophilus]|uniref:Uncharacterized protein n=1 Tax=Roseateles asaccharophilus TaxID=582607 RepID=A0ABU2AF08_9BURK|nr:hypothetical protein [Roseateles asaccharophilus]MDR7335188.1 hypothetical protein [Roseateles asaccharophilus]